jgi:hypothetical protein
MKLNKLNFKACIILALTIFVLSPADDVIVAALFGTALFGFGSLPFYILLAASSTVSVIFWKKHNRHKQAVSPSMQLRKDALSKKILNFKINA